MVTKCVTFIKRYGTLLGNCMFTLTEGEHMQARFSNYASSLLSVDENCTTANRIAIAVQTNFPEVEFVIDQTAAIGEKIGTIDTLKGRESSSKYTELLESSDKKRDTVGSIIESRLEDDVKMAYLDPEKAEKAGMLLKLLEQYPVNPRSGYTKQSAELNRRLDMFELNSELVAGTSVASLVDALITVQSEFESLISEQAVESAQAISGQVKVPELELIFRLKGLLSWLELKAIDHSEYESCATKVEEIITAVMTPARARASKSSTEEVVL